MLGEPACVGKRLILAQRWFVKTAKTETKRALVGGGEETDEKMCASVDVCVQR